MVCRKSSLSESEKNATIEPLQARRLSPVQPKHEHGESVMKKMWIQFKPDCDAKKLVKELQEIGRLEPDPENPQRMTLIFHNQSESGIKMSCFRLSEDFIQYFEDFDMVHG